MSSARSPGSQRDADQTDPGADLLVGLGDDPADDPLLVVGPNDATQVYDPNAAAAALAAPAEPAFKLVALAGPKAGAEFSLGQGEVVVGRSAEVEISIPDVSVSRRHASIALQADGTYVVTDLGSGNGTRINGERITSGTANHGDEIAVGDTVLQFVKSGAPLPKKGGGRKQPVRVSGQQADERTATRHDHARVPKKPAAPKPGQKRQRKQLYVVAGVTIGLLVLLGTVAKLRNQGGGGPAPVVAPDAGAVALFREAKSLAFNHKWIEAVRKADEALELSPDDATIGQFLEQAQVEAGYQKRVAEATEKLASGDFTGTRALLEQVPREADVFPQARALREQIAGKLEAAVVEARALADTDKARALVLVGQVLDAEPSHAEALELKTLLETPERKEPVRTTVRKREEPKPVAVVAPKKERVPFTPAHEAYLGGDVQRAMRLAEDGGDAESAALLKQLRAFDANFRQGMQLAQQERAAEAVKTLGQAVRIDRGIANGKESKPGRQAAVQLANMEYLLGIYCKGDEGLPCAARHFRAALAADPQHALAQKQLAKVEARARDIYTEAYVMKGNSPERAVKLFKLSRDSLLPSDEVHQKADRWYANLGGT